MARSFESLVHPDLHHKKLEDNQDPNLPEK
jgi:hypothetical protein